MGFSSPHFTPEGNTAELMLRHCIPLTLEREPGCWPSEVAETSSRGLAGKAFSITRALGCHSGLAGPCLGPGTRAGWCLVEGGTPLAGTGLGARQTLDSKGSDPGPTPGPLNF